MSIRISVIIAAYNAADTISKTIESLLTQSFRDWEAIVVNDGSTDHTGQIIETYAQSDARIRLISQANQGVSVARNTGIQAARYEWLYFIDSDDWVSTEFFERMTGVLAGNPLLDAVHCGWCEVAPGGTLLGEKFAVDQADMFPSFARTCAFVIHSCIVRRALVSLLGGFDTTLEVCEDWDLWQRISRAGARFGRLKEVHAFYRMQAGSLSKNVYVSLVNSMKVIERGYTNDPRVPMAVDLYKHGLHPQDCVAEKLFCITWVAGLYIGQGEDARSFLELSETASPVYLDPMRVASYLFEAVCFSTCRLPTGWMDLWQKNQDNIKAFLIDLETHTKWEGLYRCVLQALVSMILQHTGAPAPLIIENTYLAAIEVTAPVDDIYPPAIAKRLILKLEMEGSQLGFIELPVCDQLVPGWLIKDRIAVKYAWQILKRFFEHNVAAYKAGAGLRDGANTLAGEDFHDQEGWTEFLRQLWGKNEWGVEDFYDAGQTKETSSATIILTPGTVIEASEDLPELAINKPGIPLVVTMGGASIGLFLIQGRNKLVTAQALRSEIITSSGFELCIICVREALIGSSLREPSTLKNRLQQVASRSRGIPLPPGVASFLAPGATVKDALILGRRNELIGASGSRCAVLPVSPAQQIIRLAKAAHEPVLHEPPGIHTGARVLYLPGLVHTSRPGMPAMNLGAYFMDSIPRVFQKRLQQNKKVNGFTSSLPVLLYPSIVTSSTPGAKTKQVTAALFEEQLQYLQANGYYSVGWDDWLNAMLLRSPVRGKPIALTFDGDDRGFYECAWPLLKKYGFTATLFLAPGEMDKASATTGALGEKISRLSWREMSKLKKNGIEFGASSSTSLLPMDPSEIVKEVASARMMIQHKLGQAPTLFAYPFGETDEIVTQLVGACGYTMGFSSSPGLCSVTSSPLCIPRIVVDGNDILDAFINKIN